MEKNLELLIIEDNSGHLADARTKMNALISNGAQINVEYTTTLKDAETLMDNKPYDGVITDMFFPYDNQTREDSVKGWDCETSAKCARLILPHLRKASEIINANIKHYGYLKETYVESIKENEELVQKHYDWMSGKSMHPSGMLVVKKALEKGIPYNVCSDMDGHGTLMDAVCASIFGLREENSYDDDKHFMISMYTPEIWVDKRKKWLRSYTSLIEEILDSKGEKIYSMDLDDLTPEEKHRIIEHSSSITKRYALPSAKYSDVGQYDTSDLQGYKLPNSDAADERFRNVLNALESDS